MDNDVPLKIVKTNERTEKKTTYGSGFYGRAKTRDVKAYDLELHHPETGEPIFTVHKNEGYGSKDKPYSLKWHPYMTDSHPDLERSFEHGSRHHSGGKYLDSNTGIKDPHWNVGHVGARIYTHAARHGFKDIIPHTVTPTPTEENPAAHKVTFHDPDTGDAIAHSSRSGIYSDGKHTFDGGYLEKHGIDRELATKAFKEGPYEAAKKIYAEKGKQYKAIGVRTHGFHYEAGHGGRSGSKKLNATHTHIYKSGDGGSDEALSAAHEASIKARHVSGGGQAEDVSVTRHSPTVFTSTRKKYNDKIHVHSIAMGGKLYHHEFRDSEYGDHDFNHDKF